ncbi:ent-kaurenoic acid oxidase 2-like isoform X2 [Solanum tuberosum]|uniref:ent-kaurenoic acid oxidase 2-like isoform X2 n=1 Tax=Solanum tuberosum TaxID=4113 RepID=UPI00073A22FC|nr:PREDICTED: ent-kaurenoic acid oxidase 2-like isoform X2 [Solanum tuberosum]
MEYNLVLLYTSLAIGILTLISVLKRANGWFFTMKFSSKKCELPPGDMGWPLVGNMLFFFQSFKDGNLGSFVSYFVTRFGDGGMYKAFMFGKPSIIITKVETSRKIFMDDDNFDRGMPKYILKILGQVQVGGFTKEESKRLHRLTTPIKSDISLSSNYFDFANEIVKKSFEKLVAMEEPIDILLAMKRPTFEVLMRILIGDGVDHDLVDVLFEETIYLIRGCHGLPFNIPGSSYNRGLKEEQEDIVKRRSPSNEGLNFHEIKQMKYLSNVINESLRIAMAKTIFFREARTTININGYTIPKGWKFLTFSWNYHLDPHTYVRPKEFNPSRWDDLEPKPASFLPFGVGPKMCPGANLARLEVSVILHYFLLYYRVEQVNLESKIEPPRNCFVRFKKL